MHRNSEIHSLAGRVAISIMLGMCIALIGAIVEAILNGHSIIGVQSLDDIIIGILVAVVVFAYEQRRHRALLNKLQVITAMNHHVRNALQTISYAPYTEHEKQIKLIQDSVNRIQWALREILPAEESTPDSLFLNTSTAAPSAEQRHE